MNKFHAESNNDELQEFGNAVDYVQKNFSGIITKIYTSRNIPMFRITCRVYEVLQQIEGLLQAFRDADGKIKGQKGVICRSGISHGSLYQQFATLGLIAEDFRSSEATLVSLAWKGTFREDIREVFNHVRSLDRKEE